MRDTRENGYLAFSSFSAVLSGEEALEDRILGLFLGESQGLELQELIARDPIACDLAGDLTSALELMAMVQSVPEADRAVVNFGKRDCAFDAGLPQPIAHYRNGQELALRAESIVSTGIMDQHCMLRLAPGSDVQVGERNNSVSEMIAEHRSPAIVGVISTS